MPNCLKCGDPLVVNEEGIAPVLCDRCAGVATGRARSTIATGTFRDYPVTTLLLAINVTVFVAMVVTGAGFMNFSGQSALKWGGNYGPFTLSGEYWRLITAGFVHGGLIHIAFNMWCLVSVGQLSERLFGKFQTFFIYMLTGVGGALLSIAHNPKVLEVGASGAIFGIAGALLAGVKFGNLSISAGEKRSIVSSMIFFVGINFFLGAGILGGDIDNFCHLGGFVTGLLLGVPMGGFARHHKLYQWATLLVTTVILVFGYHELVQKYGTAPELMQAQAAIDEQNFMKAIVLLKQYTNNNPDDADVWTVLGKLYVQTNQPTQAEDAFSRVLKLDPDSEQAKQALEELKSAPPESNK